MNSESDSKNFPSFIQDCIERGTEIILVHSTEEPTLTELSVCMNVLNEIIDNVVIEIESDEKQNLSRTIVDENKFVDSNVENFDDYFDHLDHLYNDQDFQINDSPNASPHCVVHDFESQSSTDLFTQEEPDVVPILENQEILNSDKITQEEHSSFEHSYAQINQDETFSVSDFEIALQEFGEKLNSLEAQAKEYQKKYEDLKQMCLGNLNKFSSFQKQLEDYQLMYETRKKMFLNFLAEQQYQQQSQNVSSQENGSHNEDDKENVAPMTSTMITRTKTDNGTSKIKFSVKNLKNNAITVRMFGLSKKRKPADSDTWQRKIFKREPDDLS